MSRQLKMSMTGNKFIRSRRYRSALETGSNKKVYIQIVLNLFSQQKWFLITLFSVKIFKIPF